jgi:chromosome partitioning protein
MPRVRTIAVINQKGGVGKTTTVANLGAALAAAGRDVFLIDLDPQSHLTLHLGVEPGTRPVSMYNVMTGQADLASATVRLGEHLWLAPAVIDLAAAEVELVGTVGREQILRDRLAGAVPPAELTLIDCPPSLGLLTLNALAAADDVIIPLQPHFLGLQGLGKLLETVSLVQHRINPHLKVLGVILCLYESKARLSLEVVADLRQFLAAAHGGSTPWAQARIFQTLIRRNVKLAECPSYGKAIFDYEPSSHGAEDYQRLAEEFLAVVCGAPPVGEAGEPMAAEPDVAPQPSQGAS